MKDRSINRRNEPRKARQPEERLSPQFTRLERNPFGASAQAAQSNMTVSGRGALSSAGHSCPDGQTAQKELQVLTYFLLQVEKSYCLPCAQSWRVWRKYLSHLSPFPEPLKLGSQQDRKCEIHEGLS